MRTFYVHGQGAGPRQARTIDTVVTADSREQAICDVLDEYGGLGWSEMYLNAVEQPIQYPIDHVSKGVI